MIKVLNIRGAMKDETGAGRLRFEVFDASSGWFGRACQRVRGLVGLEDLQDRIMRVWPVKTIRQTGRNRSLPQLADDAAMRELVADFDGSLADIIARHVEPVAEPITLENKTTDQKSGGGGAHSAYDEEYISRLRVAYDAAAYSDVLSILREKDLVGESRTKSVIFPIAESIIYGEE